MEREMTEVILPESGLKAYIVTKANYGESNKINSWISSKLSIEDYDNLSDKEMAKTIAKDFNDKLSATDFIEFSISTVLILTKKITGPNNE